MHNEQSTNVPHAGPTEAVPPLARAWRLPTLVVVAITSVALSGLAGRNGVAVVP